MASADIALDQFRRFVTRWISDVSAEESRFAVRHAAIELCKRGEVWRVDDDSLELLADTADYAVPVPVNGRLHLLLEVFANGVRLKPYSLNELARSVWGNWRERSGFPSGYVMADNDTVKLVPIPDLNYAGQSLVFSFLCKPDQESDTLPPFLFDHYGEVIGKGARAYLLEAPNKPYSNQALAVKAQQDFALEINRSRSRMAQGRQHTKLVAMQRFV